RRPPRRGVGTAGLLRCGGAGLGSAAGAGALRRAESVQRQLQHLRLGQLDRAEMAGARHDERAASGETGELFGLSRQDSRVLLTADVGDRAELQEGGEAAGVQMPVGSGEDGAQEEKSGPLELLHAPRPLDEMRRDVLEDGAGDVAAASESRMRPGASGADAPEMERERARAPAQEGEAVLHVAVVETGRRAAAAEARQVE